MDMNVKKSGCIEPEELKFYFQHWGLGRITEAQFQSLFNKFDADKDGKISYKDFQQTVGSEIHPAEGLYFRQEKNNLGFAEKPGSASPQRRNKQENCKHPQCW